MAADPRTHITPDAFSVAPELLGYALATPLRRLFAIGIDLGCAALIARTGIEFLIAAAAALLAWRALGGSAERLLAGRGRLVFRAASAILALIIVVNVWNAVADRVRRLDGHAADQAAADAATPEFEGALDDLGLSTGDKAFFMVRFAALALANEADAGKLGGELGLWLKARAAPGEARDEFATTLSEAMNSPEAKAAFLRELASGPAPADSVRAPATVAANADSAAPDSASPAASDSAARPVVAAVPDSVQLLAQANQELRQQNASLRERLGDRKGQGGFRTWLGGISDDLGLGIGWFALYFTAFTVLGRGQTPGKRLLGIKVLRLDNRPISWWQAFERFGGYAASFSTGLLGFAQILWDRNRQGLHDKAVETVVIRLRAGQPLKIN